MNKVKLNLLKTCLILLTFITLTLGVIFGIPSTRNASADEVEFSMIGASVRTSDDAYGIRFSARISAVDPTSKYYVMIIPNEWRETYDLDEVGNEDYFDVLVNDNGFVWQGDNPTVIIMQSKPVLVESGANAGSYIINGTISNVLYNNSNLKFFGIAFEQKQDGSRVYADNQTAGVRSICYVASAALNDTAAGYTDDVKAKLTDTVNDAYNVSLGKKETDEQDALALNFDFEKDATWNSIDKGSKTTLELKGVPNIDLAIAWSVWNDAKSTITEDGVLTVNDDSGYFNVGATILGTIKYIMLRPTPAMKDGCLQDFVDDHGSGRSYSINEADCTQTGSRGYYLASHTDVAGTTANGIGKAKAYNWGVAFRLNMTKAELNALDFDALTVKFLVNISDNKTEVKNVPVKFFGGISGFATVSSNIWSYYTITKEQILSNGVYGKTAEESWNNFVNLYCNTGKGTNAGQIYGDNGYFYIDEIIVGSERMDALSLEDFGSSAAVKATNSATESTSIVDNSAKWVASYTDKNSVTAYGLGYVSVYSGMNCFQIRSARTEQELLAIMDKLDKVTARILVTRSDTTEKMTAKLFGVSYEINVNEWTEVTATKAQILSAYGDAATFASKFCNSGVSAQPWAIGLITGGTDTPMYIDYINYSVVNG